MHTLAIDVGGTKYTIGAFRDTELVLRETRSTDRSGGPAAMLAGIAQVIDSWESRDGFVPARCGIGFGGPVDFVAQAVVFSTHVAGWHDFPLVAKIGDLAGCPVVMDNDANVAALGEAGFGAAQGLPSMLYITLSTGIGGGVIEDGQVLRGADSYAGEIGHLTVEPDGPECLCGAQGCLERLCGGLWMERDYGKPVSVLLQDPVFARQYVVLLARGLKAALMLLNPHAIVIGGGITKAGPALFEPLHEELNRQMTAWSRARREIRPAALGDDSVLYGALALAQDTTRRQRPA